MKSRSATFILASVISLFFTSHPALAEDVVKIVSSLPRTGSSNAQTTTVVNAIRMAIEQAGSKAGKFTIKYEDWDDASPERGTWDPAVEAGNADRAIKDPDVVAYIGTYNSGAAKISMPKLNQASLLMISPANTWPGLTKPGIGEPNEPQVYRPSGKINFFRVVPTDEIQGSIAVAWAKEIGAKKVYVLHDRELYGKGIAEMFRKAAPAENIEIVGFEGIDAKASNYRSLATKIKQKVPELVYFGGITQSNAGQLIKDLRAVGVQAKFMGPDGCFENAFIEAAGKGNVEGNTYITFPGAPPSELTGKGKEFYDAYLKKYNSEPEAYAVYGFEAANIVIRAIAQVNSKDRKAIVDAVSNIKDYDGALGRWSFDANGDTSLKAMSINTVKDGKFSFVKVVGNG